MKSKEVSDFVSNKISVKVLYGWMKEPLINIIFYKMQ